MRLRSTRLGATGCNARKRDLNVAALFAAQVGRSGAWYGDSYDEILSRNREALGANGVQGGWVTPAAYNNVTTQIDSGSFVCTPGTTPSRASAPLAFPGSSLGKTVFTLFHVSVVPTSGSLSAFLREGAVPGTGVTISTVTAPTPGWYAFFGVSTTVNLNLLFVTSVNGTGCAVDSVTSFCVEDWSKLVLFDDPAGTVPVFSVFQATRGRGLLLDRSKGLVRGPELCLDPQCDDASKWVLTQPTSGSVTVSGGVVTVTSADGSYASASAALAQPTVVGKWYEVVYEVAAVSGGGVRVDLSGSVGTAHTTAGVYRRFVQATVSSSGALIVRGGSVSSGTITSLSVKELPGNHMVQPTAAARGELSRRYNRITNSGFLSGAVGSLPTDWIERGNVTGRVIDDPLSPSGKAMRVTVSVGGGLAASSDVRVPSADIVSGATTRIRVLAKRVSGSANAAWAAAVSTGVFTLTDQYAWYEADFAATSTSNGLFLGSGQVMTYDVAAVDVRPVADAIPGIPAYQRVTSATDYDEVGFPAHWRGQTDDWAYADIDPAGATKVLAMWAGQKMADAAVGCLIESSTNWGTVQGTFGVFHSPGSSTKYGSRASGSIVGQSIADSASTYPAPQRSVLRHYSAISTDECVLTINGAQAASATNDQGSGAYTSQRVYFSSRAGTSLFVNVRESAPPMLLFMQPADPGLSAREISLLDKRFAKAAGVTL